jgi:Protein of unknown function (DUF433)
MGEEIFEINRLLGVIDGYNQSIAIPFTVVGLLAAGHSIEDILNAYPYLEKEDIYEALSYATWRADEIEVPLTVA